MEEDKPAVSLDKRVARLSVDLNLYQKLTAQRLNGLDAEMKANTQLLSSVNLTEQKNYQEFKQLRSEFNRRLEDTNELLSIVTDIHGFYKGLKWTAAVVAGLVALVAPILWVFDLI